MEKDRVIYLIDSLGEGGSEKQLLNVMKVMTIQNLKIILVLWNGDRNDKYYTEANSLSHEVVSFKKINGRLKKLRLLSGLISKDTVFIHSFSYHLNIVAQCVGIANSVKSFGSIRSSYDELKSLISPLSNILNFYLTLNICSNNYSAISELKLAGRNLWFPHRINYLPNKVEVLSRVDRSSRKSKTTLKSISVGRLDENKRVDWIIDAIASLQNQGVKILHCHAGQGNLEKKLKQEIISRNLESSFLILGSVKDMKPVYLNADFLIHSAKTEGSPNVLMEAAAASLPAVTTNCGDASEIIINGDSGFVTDINDKNEFMKQCYNMASNFDMRIAMGNKAYDRASKRFDVSSLANEVLSFYSQYDINLELK